MFLRQRYGEGACCMHALPLKFVKGKVVVVVVGVVLHAYLYPELVCCVL